MKKSMQRKYYAYFLRYNSTHAYAYAYLGISVHLYASCEFMQKYTHAYVKQINMRVDCFTLFPNIGIS